MGFGTDMNLPPSFSQGPQIGEPMPEIAEALAEGEQVEREDGEGKTRKSRTKKTKEGGSSEKADDVKAATGDKIVSGVDGGQSGGGGGGGGSGGQQGQGYSMEAAEPDLPAADLNLLVNSSGEVTSAIRALAMSMAMASVGETKANSAAAESLLNQLYQGLDSTIDETNFQIMENKLAEAKEKRIEAEKKAAAASGIFGAIMCVALVIVAVVFCVMFAFTMTLLVLLVMTACTAAAVAVPIIELSGGGQEGGTIAALATTFGFEDTAAGRMMFKVVLVIILSVLTCGVGLILLPIVIAQGEVEKDLEKDFKEAERGLIDSNDFRSMAQNTPAAIREALQEAGLEEDQAEFQAFLMAMMLVLMMMMALAGATGALPEIGNALGDATSQSPEGPSPESKEVGPSEEGLGAPNEGLGLGDEGSNDEDLSFGNVDLGSFGDLGETFGEVGEDSHSTTFKQGASYENLLANKPFGTPDGTFSPEFAMKMAKQSMANVDLNAIFSDMKGMLSELGYPPEVLNDPAVQSYLDEHGQGLAEMVTGVTLGQVGEMIPTAVYVGSLEEASDAEKEEQAALNAARLTN